MGSDSRIYRRHQTKAWNRCCKKRKRPSSKEESWQEELAEELHKPIRRNFTRRRVIVDHIDETWCADLVEMQKFSKWNKGYRYLLMVLDILSKYGWIVPLKDKKAFNAIFKEGRVPRRFWVDKGKEFYNRVSSVCERWNRTIKTKMWKQFTVQGNTRYLEILPNLVKEYNNTKHSRNFQGLALL